MTKKEKELITNKTMEAWETLQEYEGLCEKQYGKYVMNYLSGDIGYQKLLSSWCELYELCKALRIEHLV